MDIFDLIWAVVGLAELGTRRAQESLVAAPPGERSVSVKRFEIRTYIVSNETHWLVLGHVVPSPVYI